MYIINNTEEEKEISIVERQTTNIFKKLEKEIKNNNINVVKKELVGFKNLIKELENQIEEQIEKNMSENNLKLYEE